MRDKLIDLIEAAKETGSPFVFVCINARGADEVIVIPKESFDAKAAYYLTAYTMELIHVMNDNVRISSFSHGGYDELKNHL